MREYDVYRLCEGLQPGSEVFTQLEELHQRVIGDMKSTYLKFIQAFLRVQEKRPAVEDNIMKMLKAVNSNNLRKVQKYNDKSNRTGASIPRVALKTLWGFADEESIKIEIEASSQIEVFQTEMMNPVELACVRGFKDVLNYFINDLNLKDKSEFVTGDHERSSIE